ncbi:hypothetical protein GS429_04820 [Natronorubrum sp. JWXQ-INN-674]|uniref:Uncharacterized protein n=1 Tax=Natronorubrum halalkaliphilum TaxID=2691917 RepID=A0A6B0VJT6_9EURY|nr:hypothetical protein [Natronorubrum halalkaliphilum]MXV61397.1 hypothetical protein [Natronorubrum halalkaliphilum]
MGTRTDAGLAVLVLVAAGIAFLVVEATVWWPAIVIGGLGTIGFELVAFRDPDTVREYWERPVVQFVSVILALVGVAVGARVAPSSVLSFVCGSLLAYLGFLAAVAVVRRTS